MCTTANIFENRFETTLGNVLKRLRKKQYEIFVLLKRKTDAIIEYEITAYDDGKESGKANLFYDTRKRDMVRINDVDIALDEDRIFEQLLIPLQL